MLFSLAIAIAGVAVLFNMHNNIPIEYAAMILVVMGTFSALPISLCWYVMNIQGDYQQALGTASMISFRNIGGIIAIWSFVATDTPLYHIEYSVVMMGLCLMTGITIIYATTCFRENSIIAADNGGRKKELLL